MKFSALFQTDSPAFNVSGYPSELFPDAVPDAMREQIMNEFYDYDIAVMPPWVWLSRFHLTINRHLYQWQKLIDSEQALRDDDAIYNYDMTETSSGTATNVSTDSSSGSQSSFVSDTPDGSLNDIEQYMSSGSRTVSSANANGQSSGSTTGQLTRKGNIGVMTAAQILGGYRMAVDFDAYAVIFRDLMPLFIGSFDLDDNGDFVPTIHSEV